MSVRVPPARPRREHAQVERDAYRQLVRGTITAEQYREAIAPRPRRRRFGRGR